MLTKWRERGFLMVNDELKMQMENQCTRVIRSFHLFSCRQMETSDGEFSYRFNFVPSSRKTRRQSEIVYSVLLVSQKNAQKIFDKT